MNVHSHEVDEVYKFTRTTTSTLDSPEGREVEHSRRGGRAVRGDVSERASTERDTAMGEG